MNLPFSAQIVATVLFALAILHTFLAKKFSRLAQRYPEGSVGENAFHLLGEVEIVFGLWAAVFGLYVAALISPGEAIRYLETRNYTEPVFVFVIMSVCATKPILDLAVWIMESLASAALSLLALNLFKVTRKKTSPTTVSRAGARDVAEFIVIMTVGPLLGSLITEPAAMTVCALMLLSKFYRRTSDLKFKYAMTGLLFVNISIGGTLTSFAAPPVLMVAQTWNWNSAFMFGHFGWKAVLACFGSTLIVTFLYRKNLQSLDASAGETSVTQTAQTAQAAKAPWWLTALHLFFVGLIIVTAHHVAVFVGLFLLFLGVVTATKEYQEPLKLKEGLLVGFFLGGLVVLGGPQGWWLAPVLAKLESFALFSGAAGLTALTDNAALTYLGSLVPDLSDASKYALVAGAVTGGGLTVIANAPNPAGYGILSPAFGAGGIGPWGLFKSALLPTVIAAAAYWFL